MIEMKKWENRVNNKWYIWSEVRDKNWLNKELEEERKKEEEWSKRVSRE